MKLVNRHSTGLESVNFRLVGEILIIFGFLGVFLNVVGFFTERMSPSIFLLIVSICAVVVGFYFLLIISKK